MHQIKFFLSYLTFDFDQTIDARCQAVNEDVVGAPPTFEWSTILLPTKVWLLLSLLTLFTQSAHYCVLWLQHTLLLSLKIISLAL